MSTFQPRRSLKRVYMRNKSAANSAASSPPVPARISTMASRSSKGSLGLSSLASAASRRSISGRSRSTSARASCDSSGSLSARTSRACPSSASNRSRRWCARRIASSWACSRPSCLSLAGFRAMAGSASCRATSSARASAWRSLVSTESARFGAVLLAEPLHAAGRVEQLLLTREEGVTAGANFDMDHGRGRARDEGIAARALDCCPLIFRMNPRFHCTHPCMIVDRDEGWKYNWHTNLEARLDLFIELTPPGTHRKLFRVSATDVLQKVPLFSQLSPVDLQRVVEVARDRAYPKNSVILFEDDPGDALYVVAKGQVKVVLIGEDGREVILSVLGEGEFFGEMALIDDEPRSAHVIAMEDSTLYVLRREDFQGILEHSPGIGLALLRELSRRLRRVDEKVGSLVLLDVHGRVAQLLLDLADETDGQRITRRLTHHTIAQMIGSSRETVSRTMRELVDKGMIDVSRKDIVIRDRGALEQAAGRGA